MPANPSTGNRFCTYSVLLIIVLVGVFYGLTLRRGLPWGDDFAMYLMHAKNLATGTGYSATGYLFNPSRPEVGPPSYPPLFPTLLAPAVAIAGLNVCVLKGEVALFFLAALWAIYRNLRRQLPEPVAVAIVAVVGFSPYFWQLRDQIISDIPFLFLLYLTLDWLAGADPWGCESPGNAIFAGLLIYSCFACRAAGIVILPSWLLYELIQRRKPTRGAWITGGVCVVCMILQVWLLRGEAEYRRGVGLSGATVWNHLREYAWSLRNDWFHVSGLGGWIVLTVFGLLGLSGFLLTLKRGFRVTEVFTALYLVMIALWAADQDFRFLLPLMPLGLMYVAVAVVRIRELGFPKFSTALTAALLFVFVFSYGVYYGKADYGPAPGGTNDQDFLAVVNYVRGATPRNATILFSKPRLLALLTDRKSAVYPHRETADDFIAFCQQIRASYVLAGDAFIDDRTALNPMIAGDSERFHLVYQSGGFRLYKVGVS